MTETAPASEPWPTLARARDAEADSRTADAIRALTKLAAMPDLESRHYAVAWTALRRLGVAPPDSIAKWVDGTVVEVACARTSRAWACPFRPAGCGGFGNGPAVVEVEREQASEARWEGEAPDLLFAEVGCEVDDGEAGGALAGEPQATRTRGRKRRPRPEKVLTYY